MNLDPAVGFLRITDSRSCKRFAGPSFLETHYGRVSGPYSSYTDPDPDAAFSVSMDRKLVPDSDAQTAAVLRKICEIILNFFVIQFKKC